MSDRIYLDFNATVPLRPEARSAVLAALDCVGNPSSIHTEGRAARAMIETAREQVAGLVGARPAEVVFTSGATEANNWVIGAGWDDISLSPTEHDAVLAPARASGAHLKWLKVATNGVVDLSCVADHVLLGSEPVGKDLVTLQLANNETGVLQDVSAMAAFCAAHGVASHCDAVQAPGRIPVAFNALGVDFLSVSSHKIGGPKGVGALIIRDGVDVPSRLVGGGQERRRRAGTEPVAAIAGFGAAAEAALSDLADASRLAAMRDRFEAELCSITPDVVIFGRCASRLPNTSCFALANTRAETLMIKLDLAGFAVSSGAACSSGKVGTSHVLAAMGVDGNIAQGALRVSLGWSSSEKDLESFLTSWRRITTSAR